MFRFSNAIVMFSTAILECKANDTLLTNFSHLGSYFYYSGNKRMFKISYTLIAIFFLSDKLSACDNTCLFVPLLSFQDPSN